MSVRETGLELAVCAFSVMTLAYVWDMDLTKIESVTGSRVAEKKFETYSDFYPFYLSQHQDETCRLLHFAGTSILIVWLFIINIQSAHKSIATFAAAVAAGLITVPLTVGVENAMYEAVAIVITVGFMCALMDHNASILVIGAFIGYALAWVGHFYFEKNKPATFTYITYSLIGDFQMYSEMFMQFASPYLKQ